MGITVDQPDLLIMLLRIANSAKRQVALLTAQVFAYHICRERNARHHNKGSLPPIKLLAGIVTIIRSRLFTCKWFSKFFRERPELITWITIQYCSCWVVCSIFVAAAFCSQSAMEIDYSTDSSFWFLQGHFISFLLYIINLAKKNEEQNIIQLVPTAKHQKRMLLIIFMKMIAYKCHKRVLSLECC